MNSDGTTMPMPTLDHNPAFFIVGCPRAGLTLLARLLDGHPLLAVAPEVHWITEHFETRTGLNLEGVLASEPLAKWLEQKKFDRFAMGREEVKRLIEPGELLPYGVFLTRLFNLYGKTKAKRLVGSATPRYVRLLPLLHSLWPMTKFVHLIRDGRDVCLSVLSWQEAARQVGRYTTWKEDPVATTALWWSRKVKQGRHGGRALGPDLYYEVHYESLVAEPVRECSNLCAFLGVPYDDAMLDFPEGWTGWDPGQSRPPNTAGLRDWSAQMPADAVERFEIAAGDLLDELGYRRASPRPQAAMVQRVTGIKEQFNRESQPRWLSQPAIRQRREQVGAMNPFVFIVGCPRSGTTLLQRLLDAHPDLAICDETFWVPYYFKKRIGLTPEGMVTPELFSRLFAYYKFCRMKTDRQELTKLLGSGEPVAYARFVTGLFDLYGEFRGKPLVGDKTPDYARNIPTLHQLWPQAKFVHLIRDGRDVCLSAVHWQRKVARLASLFSTWAEEPLRTAAAWWEWHVRRAREDGGKLGPDRYYEIRYESLVSRPAEECTKLCAFLGLPNAPCMLRFHAGRAKVDSGQDAKNSWLPITPGLRDWKTQMPGGDLERVEAVAGDLLDELGYPRGAASPRPLVLSGASSLRERFAENVRTLGDWLP
jgi:hypothetical protein